MANDTGLRSEFDRRLTESRLIIGRPKGSSHPRYPSYIYPFEYGCLYGTNGGDWEGIDVGMGGMPETTVTGLMRTLDLENDL